MDGGIHAKWLVVKTTALRLGGYPFVGNSEMAPFFWLAPRRSKFSPLPAVAAALLLSIPLVKNTRGPVLAVLKRAQHTLYLS